MYKSNTAVTLAMLLAAFIVVNSEIDISNINVNDLQSQLPAEFANTNLTLDDAKTMLKDKCIQVAGKEKGEVAFQDIETATITLGECISTLVNYTAIQAEIEEASPRGELDVVFNKYCRKRPEALECVESFNSKLVPCLDKDEQQNQDVVMRIVRSLLSFVCHKGGDQIALFIAEKGPECLESKKDDIQQCINSTFSSYVPKDGIENVKSLPKLVIGTKQCEEIELLEQCIVEKLETCQEITPANIVESLFRFVKNETTCRTSAQATIKGARTSAAAMSFTNSFVSISMAIGIIFLTFSKRIIS